MGLKPCKQLQRTLQIIDFVFRQTATPYWIHFGALIAIFKKDGVIPDGDIDICCYYEDSHKWKNIVKLFEAKGYKMSKAILNDADPSRILYTGFNSSKPQSREAFEREEFTPHICVSFWYLHEGVRYYCHDQNRELKAPGVPPSGYHFKGFENEYIKDESFLCRTEWPGISGKYKISVPIFPNLDQMYPGWLYNQQRYMPNGYQVQPEKLRDVCRTGASSRYMVTIKSMNDWKNKELIKTQLEKSEIEWKSRLKLLKKR